MGIIRIILAIIILCGHVGLIFGIDSGFAVEAFFIFSGFYVSMVLSEKYKRISNFYKSRLIRIYPLYFLILFLTFGITILLLISRQTIPPVQTIVNYLNRQSGINYWFLGLIFLLKIFIIGQDLTFLIAIDHRTGSMYFTPSFLR